MFKNPKVTVTSQAPTDTHRHVQVHPRRRSWSCQSGPLLSLLRLVKWVRGRGGVRASPTGAHHGLAPGSGGQHAPLIYKPPCPLTAIYHQRPYRTIWLTRCVVLCSVPYGLYCVVFCYYRSADIFSNTALNLRISIVLPRI